MEQLLVIGGIAVLFFAYAGIEIFREKIQIAQREHKQLEDMRKEKNEALNKIKIRERELQVAIKQYSIQVRDLSSCIDDQADTIGSLTDQIEKQYDEFRETIRKKDKLINEMSQVDNSTLEHIASLVADHLTIQYEISAGFLENKKQPAMKEAQRIRELRQETKAIVYEHRVMQYRYELLLNLFPDLELYVDDVESIQSLGNLSSLKDLDKTVDRTQYYLSSDEYSELSETERNQLALDRYIESDKSKWQIGRDYELFVGYLYSKDGWNVDYFGIDRQLEDMGRDLIAKKGEITHVIQCKYWSKRKLIHEKHIAQLYGTTVQYILQHRINLFEHYKESTIPVFVTNITLSERARSFAKFLKVKIIENLEIENFPRIKCNIGPGQWGVNSLIYHLPMDQQYDKTKISGSGEFFAFSVREAEEAGFRRAWRWHNKV